MLGNSGLSQPEVEAATTSTGYPSRNIRYVQGRVEDTLPAIAPAEIALPRLDTDWYESTRHEFVYLYPRVVRGGVAIIDDYGLRRRPRGGRRGLRLQSSPACRVDQTCRMAVKP
jgi:hypothetical protein